MWDALLEMRIVDPAFVTTWLVVSGVLVLYLLAKQWSIRWFLVAFIALFVGALIGGAVVWVAVNVLDSFGGPVQDAVWLWTAGAFAAIMLAIFNLWGSRWWRKLIAVLSIGVFAATAAFGINAAYGINRTLGALLHVSTADPIRPTPPPTDPATPAPEGPLYAWWQAPEGMPEHGVLGEVEGGVPNEASGFPARPAQLYLPPAALVENAPRLPLVIFMMGQPGDPDGSFIADTFEAYQAEHAGLAPIALVIDQLSDPTIDPMCVDSPRGAVETYVMQDVVPWARANLNVQAEPRFWTVGGYSNGGQCATSFGARHPDVFGNILSVSGEEFPGADDESDALVGVFGGNQAAYDAAKPANIMAAHGPYADSWAVFTIGSEDPRYAAGVERNAAAAEQAGMHTTVITIEGAGHVADALIGGLRDGFAALAPRLELEAPPEAAPAE
ncbi:alpha/beta hydrolase-fold protein [Agromyces larvae]|uniref:Alpha/beta hydrolase-fold protein n=1 Tax=Agromyces larvae TaxID=2929802 RepID=A0ABY4C0S9_9MICO|nr:alpha/beta hydrolase-fold protein [Agromyces larvae]UOE43556.1 alpha/beta hydrolase-fold protein [Agromyces larvae]